jgi:hypothetical protein
MPTAVKFEGEIIMNCLPVKSSFMLAIQLVLGVLDLSLADIPSLGSTANPPPSSGHLRRITCKRVKVGVPEVPEFVTSM